MVNLHHRDSVPPKIFTLIIHSSIKIIHIHPFAPKLNNNNDNNNNNNNNKSHPGHPCIFWGSKTKKKKRRKKSFALCLLQFAETRHIEAIPAGHYVWVASEPFFQRWDPRNCREFVSSTFFPEGILSYLLTTTFDLLLRKSWEKMDLQCKNVDLTGKKSG